jgi:hypothetical protein
VLIIGVFSPKSLDMPSVQQDQNNCQADDWYPTRPSVSILSLLVRRESTYTTPRTTGNVVVIDELVGFSHAGELLLAEHVELGAELRLATLAPLGLIRNDRRSRGTGSERTTC